MRPSTAVIYRQLEVADANEAAALERLCYPTIEPTGLLLEEDVATHVRTFRDGNWVATVDGQVVGISLCWRLDFNFSDPAHTLEEIDNPTFHDAGGQWLYGLDTSVHPSFRGLGIAGGIYELRREYVRANGLEGIVAGGMLPGYEGLEQQMTAQEYVDQVVSGTRYDPTLTFQLKQGFVVEGILPGYVDGTIGGGVASLIVWRREPRSA